MLFERFYDRDLAQASYLVACPTTGDALIVDPRRDLGVYIDRAVERNLRIVAVAETHIHADYLSGGRELARATGARLCVSAEGGRDWQVQGVDGIEVRRVQDGERFAVGELHIEALHTPGHTPEHISLAIFEPGFTEATLILTGDFLFVGSLGRPDLLETTGIAKDSMRRNGELLFHTLKNFGDRVPHDAPIWPGHGAGSACGKALGELPCTTWGAELRRGGWSRFLAADDAEGFVDWLLKDQPDSPTYFHRMKVWNRDGFDEQDTIPRPDRLTAARFAKLRDGSALLVDLRRREAFFQGHLPGSIHLPLAGKFATWTAWVLSEPAELILITDGADDADRAAQALLRVGHDQILGTIPFDEASRLVDPVELAPITIEEAHALWEAEAALFVDVRAATEYRDGHVEGAQHAPIARFQETYEALPKDRPLVVYCGSGARAAVAASVLQTAGYGDLRVLMGSAQTLISRSR